MKSVVDEPVLVANATLLGEMEDADDVLAESSDQESDDEECLDYMGLSSKACNFDTAINEINCKLLGISPHSPPVVPPETCNRNTIITTENKPAKTHRPPHCITCQHAKQGHGRSISKLGVCKCPMCPSQTCNKIGSAVDFFAKQLHVQVLAQLHMISIRE